MKLETRRGLKEAAGAIAAIAVIGVVFSIAAHLAHRAFGAPGVVLTICGGLIACVIYYRRSRSRRS